MGINRLLTSNVAALAFVQALAVGGASVAHADVDAANGTFNDSIPIAVPAFRSITPDLSLSYDSSDSNGWAGVGWSLGDVSEIERASAGRGAPKYDANDIYLLDGLELLPCIAGSVSPSCTSGGTHAPKQENYSKIVFSGAGAASRWTITSKNGIKTIYAPVYVGQLGADATWGTADDANFRWGISQVVDTKGNTVSYNWTTNQSSTWENLSSVTYNGTTITLYYETRTDSMRSAVGAGALSNITGRLKTIDIKVSAARLRTYTLGYTSSAATTQALLTSVKQYGRDAVVDAAGAVTGGTSFPAVTAGYQAPVSTFTAGAADVGMGRKSATASRFFPADLNGDGKSDMIEMYPGTGTWLRHIWMSNGSTFVSGPSDTAIGIVSNQNFFTMDVNGDGKMDMVDMWVTGMTQRRVWLSDGTNLVAQPIDAQMGWSPTQSFLTMDVNGDGKTDMIELFNEAGRTRHIWYSTGTGFSDGPRDYGMGTNPTQSFYALDVNGDGKSDMIETWVNSWFGGSNRIRRIWMSTGSGFVMGAEDVLGDFGQQFFTVDVNGDGKTDMVETWKNAWFGGANTARTVWLSTGSSFVATATDGLMPWVASQQIFAMDVNGDGLTDMVYTWINSWLGGSNTARAVYLSTGDTFVAGGVDGLMPNASSTFIPMDVNGDGSSDMVEFRPNGTTYYRAVYPMNGSTADLLTSRTTELGGVTTVTYQPSSAWANPAGPAEVFPTVASVTTNDGRGGSATTSYVYSGYVFDPVERQSLGFRYQKQTLPCIAGESTCPYNETWFRQDIAAATSIERVDQRNGSGALLASTVNVYATNGTTVPRTSLLTGIWSYSYINTGAACPGADCKRTYVATTYNAYGEPTQEVSYGDWDATGDERTTTMTYAPNATAYIVNMPATVRTYQGEGATGTLLGESLSYYDGATVVTQAPTAGLATKVSNWLSSPSSYVENKTEYDSYGNVTAVVNPLLARTSVAFDASYHTFAISTTNALAQVTTTAWDAVCGQPTQVTNLDGQATTMTYDALCRLTQKSSPGGKVESYSWANLGNPTTQYSQVDRPAADGTANPLWSRTYFDGFQRSYRAMQKGPNAATGDIVADTAYNARGSIGSVTAPYYWVSGQAQPTTYTTTTSYDALDRSTRVTFPDAAFTATSYGLRSATSTDELGRAKTDRFDARGNRIAHEETVGGVIKTTSYLYDPRGNLKQVTDPGGNVFSQVTDSLGRKTQTVDVDWGTTSYEYDGVGHITASTDAKAQRTTFTYDSLDRKLSKISKAGTAGAATVAWAYDQARAGFYNKGALTTVTDAAGTKTLDYDVAGRVAKVARTINGTTYTFNYGYDAGDRSLWTTYPDGDTLGTVAAPVLYDSAGRIKSIPGYVTSTAYNAEGALTQINNANGTVTARAHSPQRGWMNGVTTMMGATTLQNLAYTRNAKGMITGVTSPIANEGWTYTKDELDRLTVASNTSSATNNQTLAYDALGNIASNTRLGSYAYHATKKHAVVTAGANTYTYDATGLMTSGAGRTITWNGDNQVASVISGGVTQAMTYDADGQRIQQVEGATTRRYLGDDYEVTVGSTTSKYISVAGAPVARKDGTTLYWLHTDNLGSIQAETNAAGVEVLRKKYRPFGEILSTAGTLPYEPRGFTAQRQDASGLVYLHARFYDPMLGRFISPDPVIDGSDTSGLNRYAYVANNPIDKTDIDGFSAKVKKSFMASPNNRYKGIGQSKVRGISGMQFSAQTVTSRKTANGRIVTTNNSNTAQIRSSRDSAGGVTLRTQYSTHYFAPPPPPPPPPPSFSYASAGYSPAQGGVAASAQVPGPIPGMSLAMSGLYAPAPSSLSLFDPGGVLSPNTVGYQVPGPCNYSCAYPNAGRAGAYGGVTQLDMVASDMRLGDGKPWTFTKLDPGDSKKTLVKLGIQFVKWDVQHGGETQERLSNMPGYNPMGIGK